MGEIRLEMTKMRRLHVIPLTLVLLVAAISAVSLSLFAPGAVSRLTIPMSCPGVNHFSISHSRMLSFIPFSWRCWHPVRPTSNTLRGAGS